jgi:4-hydroxy-tetrahydrodipicolinate synthase
MTTSPLFNGIIPPLATPLRAADELDHAGLERLVAHVLQGGVHGLFVLGTTGEGPSLGYALRYELVERVCALVADRVPVLVGITDTAFAESLALGRHAADCGAAALVMAPPYYLPLGQADLGDYFRRSVPQLPLPVMLYNMPACTKTAIALETARDLMQMPQIVGIKDSSGDFDDFTQLVGLRKERPDWSVLIGPERRVAEAVLAGGQGGVCGGGNVLPRLFVDIYAAAKSGETDHLPALHRKVDSLGRLYAFSDGPAGCIRGIKTALAELGICSGVLAEPLASVDPALVRAVRSWLSDNSAVLPENGLARRDPLGAIGAVS